jgi:hypothetical protein
VIAFQVAFVGQKKIKLVYGHSGPNRIGTYACILRRENGAKTNRTPGMLAPNSKWRYLTKFLQIVGQS